MVKPEEEDVARRAAMMLLGDIVLPTFPLGVGIIENLGDLGDLLEWMEKAIELGRRIRKQDIDEIRGKVESHPIRKKLQTIRTDFRRRQLGWEVIYNPDPANFATHYVPFDKITVKGKLKVVHGGKALAEIVSSKRFISALESMDFVPSERKVGETVHMFTPEIMPDGHYAREIFEVKMVQGSLVIAQSLHRGDITILGATQDRSPIDRRQIHLLLDRYTLNPKRE